LVYAVKKQALTLWDTFLENCAIVQAEDKGLDVTKHLANGSMQYMVTLDLSFS